MEQDKVPFQLILFKLTSNRPAFLEFVFRKNCKRDFPLLFSIYASVKPNKIQNVQESDTTDDTMKYECRANKYFKPYLCARYEIREGNKQA